MTIQIINGVSFKYFNDPLQEKFANKMHALELNKVLCKFLQFYFPSVISSFFWPLLFTVYNSLSFSFQWQITRNILRIFFALFLIQFEMSVYSDDCLY